MAKKRAKATQDDASRDPISPEISPDLSYIAEGLRPLATPIAELTLDPRNARKHDERNLAAIGASLRQYGFREVVVVQLADDGRKIVRAGNGRVQAATANGWTHVPAVLVREDDQAATGFAIADNRTAELAEWDQSVLAELIGEIDLDGLDEELGRMLGDLDAEVSEALEAAGVGTDETAKHTNRGGSDPGEQTGSPTTSAPADQVFKIIVTCKDEKHQLDLLQRFETEEIDARPLIA